MELRLDKLPDCRIVDYTETLDKFMILDDGVKREVFFELLAMAHSDMEISHGEIRLIDIAAEKFGISEELIDDLSDVLTRIMRAYRRLHEILSEG